MRIGFIFPMAIEASDVVPEARAIASRGGILSDSRGPFKIAQHLAYISGVGKTNAALAAHILAQHTCTAIILVGTGAALDASIPKGAFITAKSAQYHDVDVTALNFTRGEIPYDARHIFDTNNEINCRLHSLCAELNLKCIKGNLILTGDQFIAHPEHIGHLQHTFPNAECIDMEAAAVGHALRYSHIPWTVIRFITDHANADAAKEFENNMHAQAIERIGLLIKHLIK